MRIAFIAGEYQPMQGGLGDFTRELARACLERGHESHVLTKFVVGSPREEIIEGIRVHRLVEKWDWRARRFIEDFVRAKKIDVVNLQYQAAAYQMHPAINLLPGALAKTIPTVVTFHDLRVPYLFPKAGALRWRAILHMAKCASACVVTNAEDFETLEREGITTHLIPIGSNIAPTLSPSFDRSAWLRERGIPLDQKLVGYFGFLNESKGGETLIRAIALLHAQRNHPLTAHRERRSAQDDLIGLLHIGGQTGDSDPTNANYARQLSQIASQLGVSDRIFVTGFLDDAGVSAGFAACDVIALPYRDGASFRRGTLMAALAHGCAIVTTMPRVNIPEFRHEVNMLLVAPDDSASLAAAISRVLHDDELRARLQQGALKLSEMFQWTKIAEKTEKVLASSL
jgi:glycosyltransferase involved in cell wall biosynthesis